MLATKLAVNANMVAAKLYSIAEGPLLELTSPIGDNANVDHMAAFCMRRRIARLSDFQKLTFITNIWAEQLPTLLIDDERKHLFVPYCVELDSEELVLISVDGRDDQLIQNSFFSRGSRALGRQVLVLPARMANDFAHTIIHPALSSRECVGTGLRIVHGFMVGRSGSTLLTRAISSAASSVITFREPHCFDNVLPLLYKSGNMSDPDGKLVCSEYDLIAQRDWSDKSG